MRAYNFTVLGESASNPTYTTPSVDSDLITKLYADTVMASAGGGGGSVLWTAPDGKAPLYEEEFSHNVWKWGDGLDQELWTVLKVPDNYQAGNQFILYINAYSPSTSNTWKLQTTSYLIKAGVTAVNDTTNSHASTNSNITNATTANKSQVIELDLSDGSGEINSVALAAGDTVRVKLTRAGGTTDTADVRMIDGTAETKAT